MSDYNIEIKRLEGELTRLPGQGSTHIADNVTNTATGSWTQAIADDAITDIGAFLIVYNAGTSAIALACDSAASPSQYHVIAPGTQRDVNYIPGKPVKVKTL